MCRFLEGLCGSDLFVSNFRVKKKFPETYVAKFGEKGSVCVCWFTLVNEEFYEPGTG